MAPTNPIHSKLNLLRANLKQLRESHLFSEAEKKKLIAKINEQLEKLNNHQETPIQFNEFY